MSHMITVTSDGILSFLGQDYRCAIGKMGVTDDKREGDNATPLGRFALRELYYRPDKLTAPPCTLPTTTLEPSMGWCDAPDHTDYNMRVSLPFPASHEQLWREDARYDIIIPLGYNDDPPVAGKGSAIFFHIAAEDYAGTEGCVAVSELDMLEILARIDADTVMEIVR